MRCHPFTSRHATHLYHDLNKAFAHLVFTEEEMAELLPDNCKQERNAGVIAPIIHYKEHIEKAGLFIVQRRDITQALEKFFHAPQIVEKIKKITKSDSFPQQQMTVQFLDYVLKSK